MKATIDRGGFLHLLEAVQPGISPGEVVSQSGSFVFSGGMVITYNTDVACRVKSGLPKDFVGAVKAKAFLELLKKMEFETLELSVEASQLIIRGGKTDRVRLRMDGEMTLPLSGLERPTKQQWRPVHEEFNDAVGIVSAVAGKDTSQFIGMCVHMTPKWVEATDGFQLARYNVDTGLAVPVLVKKDSLKHVVPLDVTKICETDRWVHFRNPAGVTMSVKRHTDPFPDLKANLKVSGEPAALPKGLAQAVSVASIFSKENPDSNLLILNIRPPTGKEKMGKMMVTGIGTSGDYSKLYDIHYTGLPMAFTIPPEILAHIATKHSDCILTPKRLKVEGGKWQYVTTLGNPESMTPVTEKKPKVQESLPPPEETEDVS